METLEVRGQVLSQTQSSYRTYEEWKRIFYILCTPRSLVLTVPMRNGNSYIPANFFWASIVLTVPMRNGNTPELIEKAADIIGSYRTYEEWKHRL